MECPELKRLEDERDSARAQFRFFSQINKSVHGLSPRQTKQLREEHRTLAEKLGNDVRVHHLICDVCKAEVVTL